jgi:hypothetical protein
MKAVVGVMLDLAAKTSQDGFRKRKIPGVGFRSIFAALQRGKGTSRLRQGDTIEAMCLSLTSLTIFEFEGADGTDLYFSLKGTREEILQKLQDLPEPPPFDRSQYEIDASPVSLPAFERLAGEGEAVAHECDALFAGMEELGKKAAHFEAYLALSAAPGELRRRTAEAQETLVKLTQTQAGRAGGGNGNSPAGQTGL